MVIAQGWAARLWAAVLLLALVPPGEALAARGSKGSFRGSSGSKGGWGRSSTPARPAPRSAPASKPSAPSNWGSRPSAPPRVAPAPRPPQASDADAAAHRKAVQSNPFGGAFPSEREARDRAVEDFKKKHAPQYPSVYKEKPQARPEHIPDTVTVDGKPKQVEYRVENGTGGYYYRDALGRWILYDMLADAARRDNYMYRHGYDPSGTTYVGGGGRSGGGGGWVWVLLGVVVVLALAGIVYYYYVGPGSVLPGAAKKPEKKPEAGRPPPQGGAAQDASKAAHWESVRPGDILTLKDEQTLELLMKENRPGFTRGLDLTVKVVRRIAEQRGLMRWILYEMEKVRLEGEDQTWYVLVKVVDDAFDLRVLFVPPDFRPGSRSDLVDGGARWVFKPPADESDFRLEELEFVDEIEQALDDGRAVLYKKKPQGILFGELTEEPAPSGITGPQFVSVLEYRADADGDNPELLLLEIGGAGPGAGGPAAGYVLLLQGANVGTQDLELMRT